MIESLTMWINVNLPVRLERLEDGGYSAVCPTIHGCASQGSNYADALGNLREAIAVEAEAAVARAEAEAAVAEAEGLVEG